MVNRTASLALVILLILIGYYSLTWQNKTESTTITTTSSTNPLSTTSTASLPNFLRRKFYINESSGAGLQWFSNDIIKNVRDGVYIWQYETDNMLQFYEVNDSNADIVIQFVSGISQNSTTKTIGETYVKTGLIKGNIQIVPQGVPCRNVGITMHELGHVIGLDHNTTNRFDIMYPLQSYGCDQNISSYDVVLAKQQIEELIS